MKYLAPLAVLLLLTACSSPDPAPDDKAASADLAPLAFMAPPSADEAADADLDSDVAPYVMARGAGPSRLSPDGSTVATRLSLTGTRQLYVMDARADDPKSTLRQLSQGSGITFFDFSPTGALIYGADNNGDERENYWMVEPSGSGWSDPRLILPATDKGFRNFGDFTGDGSQIVYASTERNGLDYDIYVADVATGEARRVFEGVYGNYVQAVAPDGSTAIISETVGEDSDRLFVLDLTTGERTVISDPTPRANHVDAGVSYWDADHILIATNRGAEYLAPTILPINPARTKDVSLSMPAVDADIDSLRLCGRSIVTTVNRDGFSELVIHSPGLAAFDVDLPRGVYSVDCSDTTALVRVSASNIPGDLYAVDIATREATRIFESDFDDLDPSTLILPESIRLKARDGVEVQGLLYTPFPPPPPQLEQANGQPVAPPPVVFIVHGGPTAQSRPSYNSTVQYLLSKGIAVFQSNVRGSTGFGRTYATLDDQRLRQNSVRDLVDMLDYLGEQGLVDADRAAVMGGSYGGYAVNAVLSEHPDAFKAGVSLFGVGDWVTALEVASPALKASDIIEYGDISDPDVRAFHASISPVAKADQIKVPVLYSHGAMDPRIDIAETEIMVRALRDRGIRADYVRIPDEGHGWRKLRNRLYYQRVQAEFLEDVLDVD